MNLAYPLKRAQYITQEFGKNAPYYSQFTIGGVALKGHEGLDFTLEERLANMASKKRNDKIKLAFYILIGILGFFLLVIDTTPGHPPLAHLAFLRENIDAAEGIVLIFISGYNLGKLLKI